MAQDSTAAQMSVEPFAFDASSCLCCLPSLRAHRADVGCSCAELAVGELTVHVLTDGAITTDAAWVFPSVGGAELAAAFPGGRAALSFGCALLRTPELLVLLDTSLGIDGGAVSHLVQSTHPSAATPARPMRDLRELLAEVGVAPSEVDVVVHTHLHRDHTSWNVVPDERGGLSPCFPRAKHLVRRAELDYWGSTEAHRARCQFETNIAPLISAGLVHCVEGDATYDICPGVSLLPLPGHTPAHQIVQICSRGQRAFFVGDALHFLQQVERPDWSPRFDYDEEVAAEQRATLLARIERENATLIAPHFPFPGLGTLALQMTGNGGRGAMRFVPTSGIGSARRRQLWKECGECQ